MADNAALPPNTPSDFIREAIVEDLSSGRFSTVHTRFPPEPNGYLHIGHAKALAIDFGAAREFGGKCNLRYDDTNPTKEDVEYVDAIKEDIRWLGFDWEDREYYASDYFPQLYDMALDLIRKGKAYVDDLSADDMRTYRGTLTEPGRDSPFRNRSVEENLDLFERMRAGEFPDGSRTLRAKIDMASPNIVMRDPVMYRILHEPAHHRSGREWCIYPMYDFAHGQSDSIEGITHSLCSLEYEIHRPLYEWFLRELEIYAPRQIEFARLNLTYTVLSKRKLVKLVKEGFVNGWDDPRMPTLTAMRRRGYPPEAVLAFLAGVGVAKNDSIIDIARLEEVVRDSLNRTSPRRMAVLKPIKLVIDNYPEDKVEWVEAINNPEDPDDRRSLPFSKELYIEADDFRAEPPPKYFRLSPGREVRLRYAYFVTATSFETDADGNVTVVHATYDPATFGGSAPDGRKVKSTIHWLSARHALPAEVRQYDRLFNRPNPESVDEDDQTFLSNINPNSLEVSEAAFVEPSLAHAAPGERFQFERIGYFNVDIDSAPGKLVFNRTVGLKDTWAKIEAKA